MYVCCLFNNIEFRANPPLYTIVQYIKTSVDSTMLKIRNEKKKKFIKCMIQKNKTKEKLFQIVGIFRILPLDHIEIRPCQFYRFIDLVTIGEVNHPLKADQRYNITTHRTGRKCIREKKTTDQCSEDQIKNPQ
jgi:hypothetical protein